MKPVALILLLTLSTAAAFAQASASDEAQIRTGLAAQADAWNRADIPAFMLTYENSPETTFIGATLRKGYGPILERYTKAYTTPEQMGKLTFGRPDSWFLHGWRYRIGGVTRPAIYYRIRHAAQPDSQCT